MEEKKEIYLDYHATTPVLPEVLEAMSPYFCTHFGNANSVHQWGWKAEMALAKSSKQVADLVEAKPSQVYFTSGATESLHWVLTGWTRKNSNPKILTTSVEHKATYGACDFAKELGAEVVELAADSDGLLDLTVLEKELQEERPTLLSLIFANNEIGSINPVQEVCDLKNKYPHFRVHADGAQAVGKIPVNFKELGLDYLSFSGHKIYAPKGIGGLIMAESGTLVPLFSGGGQQKGQRAGTTDVPSIVALGVACQWARNNLQKEGERLTLLRDQVINKFLETDWVQLNGHRTKRLPNNMNFTFKSITMDKLLLKLPKVGFSSSSACSSGATTVSHVLKAIGRSDQEARQTVRFGMGHGTTPDDMEYVTKKVLEALEEAAHFTS